MALDAYGNYVPNLTELGPAPHVADTPVGSSNVVYSNGGLYAREDTQEDTTGMILIIAP